MANKHLLPETPGEGFFAVLAVVVIVCWLVLWIGAIYVALHFIGKWW